MALLLTPGRQASAGTGKSYLLSTIYLWCIVNGLNCKAAAPTGIAAANVEVEGTDVVATTLHALLELDAELQTKLDLAKLDHAKVAALMKLQVCRRPKCSTPRDSRAPHNSMLIVPGWENRLKHHVLIMAQSTINYGERGSI